MTRPSAIFFVVLSGKNPLEVIEQITDDIGNCKEPLGIFAIVFETVLLGHGQS